VPEIPSVEERARGDTDEEEEIGLDGPDPGDV
jgi:hypothetical protein